MLLSDKHFKNEVDHLEIYNPEFFKQIYPIIKTFFKKTGYNRLESIHPITIIEKAWIPYKYDENLYCPSYDIYYKNVRIITINSNISRFNSHYQYNIHHFYNHCKLYQLCDYFEIEKIFENKNLCEDVIKHVFSYF